MTDERVSEQERVEVDAEKFARLMQRIAEQQSVETAYAMEEASEEEMFTATAATYAAAQRLSLSQTLARP